jgi:hypothetical protein
MDWKNLDFTDSQSFTVIINIICDKQACSQKDMIAKAIYYRTMHGLVTPKLLQ